MASIRLSILLLAAQGCFLEVSACSITSFTNSTNVSSSFYSRALYFGLMLSQSGDQQSTGALAGVQTALNDINSRHDLLSGYSLNYTLTDTQCDRTATLVGLFTQLFRSPHDEGIVALIGSGCPVATEATAEISSYVTIPLISCTSSFVEFSDHVNYFQLLPSEALLAQVFHSIVKEYSWRRVALIIENTHRFKTTVDQLTKMLSTSKVMYSKLSISSDENQFGQLTFYSQFRIYILAMNLKLTRQLLCKAHNLGIKYPKYVFLTYATYKSQWWFRRNDDGSNYYKCNPDNIAEVLQFSLAVSHFHFLSSDRLYYHVCYDATWAIACALHKLLQDTDLHSTNELLPKIDSSAMFCRNNCSDIHSQMRKYLRTINFTGSSGTVYFGENGIRVRSKLSVWQYRLTYINGTPIVDNEESMSHRLRLIPVAYFGQDGRLEIENNRIWPVIPYYDGVPQQKIVTISLPVAIVLSVLNVIGIIYAVICLLFNAIFHKKRLIRLDSPNLNYLIILGSCAIYISCILFVTPTLNTSIVSALCILRVGLSATGYTLMYGSVITKLWRIYTIFHDPKTVKNKQGIKDHHLMLIVLSLSLVDISIVIVYIAIEGTITHFSVGTEPNKERLQAIHGEQGIETVFISYTCSSNTWIRMVAIGILYLYKFILYICALCFAFRLRKVNIKGLNDAKYITASVYTTSILIAVTSISTLTLSKYVNAYGAIYSFGFWLGTSAVLGLLFIPKMIRLYKDPDGVTVFPTHHRAVTLELHNIRQH